MLQLSIWKLEAEKVKAERIQALGGTNLSVGIK